MLRIIYFPFECLELAASLELCPLPTSFNPLIINELQVVYNSTIYGGGVKLGIVKALADHISL